MSSLNSIRVWVQSWKAYFKLKRYTKSFHKCQPQCVSWVISIFHTITLAWWSKKLCYFTQMGLKVMWLLLKNWSTNESIRKIKNKPFESFLHLTYLLPPELLSVVGSNIPSSLEHSTWDFPFNYDLKHLLFIKIKSLKGSTSFFSILIRDYWRMLLLGLEDSVTLSPATS